MAVPHPGAVHHPPLDGSLFLPELLEFNVQHNPDITFFIYDKPDSNDLVSISHLDFYQACHRAAQEIRPGRTGDKEVVAILANSDTLLYQTVFMGIIFAGLIVCDCFLRIGSSLIATILSHSPCLLVIQRQQS
jgi:acyl-CoA synthetase (AMP-forming)/AMP-acid ligase II